MKKYFKRYLTKRFYHYSLVLGIGFLAYAVYKIYTTINNTIEQRTSLIDLFSASINITVLEILINYIIIASLGTIIMNYAKKGFSEKVYSDIEEENHQK